MAEIYVPGGFDFMAAGNALAQLQSAQQARQSNALQMQYTMEDRARAEQGRKIAAGNALAERAALSKALEYSVVGGAGPEQPNLGRAADTLAKQGRFGSASTISNYLEQIAKQEEQQAKAAGQGYINQETQAKTAGQLLTNTSTDYKNTADFIKMTNAQIDAAPDIASLKAVVAATFTPGHPMAKFNELNGLTLEQSMAAIDGLIAQGKTFEQIRAQMSQGATAAAKNFADLESTQATAKSTLATAAQTVAQTAAAEEKRTAPVPKEMDAGGEILVYDSNPLSETHLQILKRVNKTLTPAETKPPAVVPTNLAKLLTEQATLPPDSPARQQYDAAIAKELAVSDAAQSPLGKLVTERNRLNPNDPLRAQYDAAILKEASGGALSQSPIGKLVAERDKLPPGDPLRAQYDAAIAKETGSAGAVIKAEDAVVAAEDLVGKIEALLKHPGKSEAVGISFGTGNIPGTDARGFISRHDEIKGSAFLDAYNSLRGTGSITEIEGVKATAAKNRMDLSTSEEEYETAAKEYMGYIKRGVEREKARMQKLTGGAGATSATQPKIARSVDIEHTAKQNSMSVEDTKARLRSMGYKIEGE